MDENILFLHGLESGLNGDKCIYLQKTFSKCICPDLQVSKFKIYLKNSFLRNIVLNPYFLSASSAFFLFSYLVYSKLGVITGLFVSLISLVPILKLSKGYILRNAVKKSLEKNIELAYSNIVKYEPKVIIGSSWGGCVLINLIQRGLWKGHSILIAPAFYEVNKIIFNNQKEKIKEFRLIEANNLKGKIIVYHSVDDEVIPYEDSQFLCGMIECNLKTNLKENKQNSTSSETFISKNIELRTIRSDDHGLNTLISEATDFKLKKDIEELLKLN